MSNSFKDLNQPGVLWLFTGKPDDFGRPRVLQPKEIKCRWELGSQVIDSPLANTERIVGRVFVDRYVPVQSLLAQGDISIVQNPPYQLMKVLDYSEISDVKGKEPRRFVLVGAWDDALPEAV